MQPRGSNPILWHGQQEFWLVGTDHHEDTLRIESNYSQAQAEHTLRLTLPTLCITYANMQFTNAIGGKQENYPASSKYGPIFFDPPVMIADPEEVEKITWIRGAHRVVIGPKETEIEWYMWNALVIPRLRLEKKEPATALLTITDVPISVDKELTIDVMQYADGRNLGGIRVEKRHPNWKPREEPKEYDLWIRVVDGDTMEPIPEAMLNLLRWDPDMVTPYGKGGFHLVEQCYTDENGVIHDPGRSIDELEAVTLSRPGWRAVARCFRPLPGQRVWFHMHAWRLREDCVPYTWQQDDTLEEISLLTGYTLEDILHCNRLSEATALRAGMRISLPCYAATYRMEPGDTFEWLAEAFDFASVEELAKFNGFGDPSFPDGCKDIELPGWHFFYARRGDSLEHIDSMFGLSLGSSRTVGRVHHPYPGLPYESETVAVPTVGFVKAHVECPPT